jgi:transcriptional regulator with XRE-family HTH domain
MNVEPRLNQPRVHADVWQRQEMRRALAVRDLGTVFRLLQKHGISQRAIAGLTGMSSSEVYEVLRGRRVMAYDVLCRVADGFGVERGYLGLAFDGETAQLLDRAPAAAGEPDDDGRALLAYAAAVTVGTAEAMERDGALRRPVVSPLPCRVSPDDVVQVEAVTAQLRELDYRFGGGACCEAVLAHAAWAERLCDQPTEPEVARRLVVAVADASNLAGWTAFDVGLYSDAGVHLGRALDRARQAAVPSLTANVLYRAGRVRLHRGMTQEALRFFQLGQLAAQESGSARTGAMLCANIAWAYAELGDAVQAGVHLGRATDEFNRGAAATEDAAPEPWAQFFGAADLAALTGMTELALARRTPSRAVAARHSLGLSIAARGPEMARSLAFEHGALAGACLIDRDSEAAVEVGEQALARARRLRSRRVLERLGPLVTLAAGCTGAGSGPQQVRELGRRIEAAVRTHV